MRKVVTLSLAVAFTVSCSAQWGKKIKGNGDTVTIDRNVGDYDQIALAGWFDVDLVDGKEGKLSLKGESNLLEYVVTEVIDGKLTIKVEKGVDLKPSSWEDGIRITIPVESITSLALSGSGDIVGKKTIKTDNFKTSMSGSGDITIEVEAHSIEASMSGSGDITLSGRTSNFDATISGSGDIKAYELDADNVEATVSGSADINAKGKGIRFRRHTLSWQP